MPTKPMRVRFPVSGINRAFGYQAQPPFTCPDALNVRPTGIEESRARGGSRPTLTKTNASLVNGANPVRLLDVIHPLNSYSDEWLTFRDSFDNDETNLRDWIAPFVSGLLWPMPYGAKPHMLIPRENVGPGHPYTITLKVPQVTIDDGDEWKEYWLYFDWQRTAVSHVWAAGGSFYCLNFRMKHYAGEAATTDTPYNHYMEYRWVTCEYNPDTYTYDTTYAVPSGAYSRLYMIDYLIPSNLIDAMGPNVEISLMHDPASKRAYWRYAGRYMVGVADRKWGETTTPSAVGFHGPPLSDRSGPVSFSYNYRTPTNVDRTAPFILASAGGELKRGAAAAPHIFGSVTDSHNLTLPSDRRIPHATRLHQTFISDTRDDAGSGTAYFYSNRRLQMYTTSWATDYPEFSQSANPFDEWVLWLDKIQLYPELEGCYRIDANDGTSLWVSAINVGPVSATGADDGLPVHWRLSRPSQVYDARNDTQRIWWSEKAGSWVPTGCTLMCEYRSRIVLAGNPSHMYYMSRSGDPFDFDYGADYDDVTRAMYGSITEAGELGKPIVALIPHSDDYLIFGLADEMHLMRGDPAAGGRRDTLSRSVGIHGPEAWARGPNSEIFFLSPDQGLFKIHPGGVAYPVPISETQLPLDLSQIDPSKYTVRLAYDTYFRGLHIFVVNDTDPDTNAIHWYYDLRFGGSWKSAYWAGHQPTTLGYDSTLAGTGVSPVLLGAHDGYVRHHRNDPGPNGHKDDGEFKFESYVDIGPFLLGPEGGEGIITEMIPTMAENAGANQVEWSVRAGDTGEGAYDKLTPDRSGQWGAGRNYVSRPMVAGTAAVIRLRGLDTAQWAMEEFILKVKALTRRTIKR